MKDKGDIGFLGGINDLEKELSGFLEKSEPKVIEQALMTGAKMLVTDLNKLPSPRSKIHKSGYTHLIDSMKVWKDPTGKIKVGWGKYYGPVLEHGSKKLVAQPHLRTTWNVNKDKYQTEMIKFIMNGG